MRKPPTLYTVDDVLQRTPLLKRVVSDLADVQATREKNREFLEELIVISKKFASSEIDETAYRLRRDLAECDREIEEIERELRLLGGLLKDRDLGLIYFYSERDSRRIFLVWDPRQPETVSWHELGESFDDRMPIVPREDEAAPAVDSSRRE